MGPVDDYVHSKLLLCIYCNPFQILLLRHPDLYWPLLTLSMGKRYYYAKKVVMAPYEVFWPDYYPSSIIANIAFL